MHLVETIQSAIVLGAVIATILGYRRHAKQDLTATMIAREIIPPAGLGTNGGLKPQELQNGHIRMWDRIDSIDERLAGMDSRFRGIDERMANAERDRQLLVQSSNDTNTMVRQLLERRLTARKNVP